MIARLIIAEIHIKKEHCGKQHLIAFIGQKFWIPCLSRLVLSFLKQCALCRKLNALPLAYTSMEPLLADRVVWAKPFEHSDINFLGPYECKEHNKLYISLFTCLRTKAVHSECVENLSAGAFLKCLQRFVARRGVPKCIRSDQGGNFCLAERVL
uniref:Integrase_H2C2 domain-containing protein n=1 Tax=Heterorhabditis bacteriophora TaxID=37862 RepID=A0A1I7WHU5_HETBA